MPKLVTRMTGLAAGAVLAPDDPAPSLLCEQPVRAPRARAAAPPESRDLREMVGVMCVPFVHDAPRQKHLRRLCDRAERDNKMRRRAKHGRLSVRSSGVHRGCDAAERVREEKAERPGSKARRRFHTVMALAQDSHLISSD